MASAAQTLQDIIAKHMQIPVEKRGYKTLGLINDHQELRDEIIQFLDTNGYKNLSLAGSGSDGIALKIGDNNDYIIRIGKAFEKRPAIPQMIQPIFSRTFSDVVKLEMLPNIAATEREVTGKRMDFENELATAGFRFDTKDFSKDVGIFRFGKYNVAMAMDPGMFGTSVDDSEPRCTASYPPLEIQWKKQAEIVRKDERLQKLLGGLEPEKLPPTRIIQTPAAGGKRGV